MYHRSPIPRYPRYVPVAIRHSISFSTHYPPSHRYPHRYQYPICTAAVRFPLTIMLCLLYLTAYPIVALLVCHYYPFFFNILITILLYCALPYSRGCVHTYNQCKVVNANIGELDLETLLRTQFTSASPRLTSACILSRLTPISEQCSALHEHVVLHNKGTITLYTSSKPIFPYVNVSQVVRPHLRFSTGPPRA